MIAGTDCLSQIGCAPPPSRALDCLKAGLDKFKSKPVFFMPCNTTVPECACMIEGESQLSRKTLKSIGGFDPRAGRGEIAHGAIDHRIGIDDQLRGGLDPCTCQRPTFAHSIPPMTQTDVGRMVDAQN